MLRRAVENVVPETASAVLSAHRPAKLCSTPDVAVCASGFSPSSWMPAARGGSSQPNARPGDRLTAEEWDDDDDDEVPSDTAGAGIDGG